MARETSTEGHYRCASCLQWVGTAFDGETRPYTVGTYVDEDGSNPRTLRFCADKEACERGWKAVNAPDPWAEADPNEEADDINDVGDIEDEEPTT